MGNCGRGTNLSPIRLGSCSQRWPSSHLPLDSPQGQGGSGLPLAPWALLMAGGLRSWKPTPNVFAFARGLLADPRILILDEAMGC